MSPIASRLLVLLFASLLTVASWSQVGEPRRTIALGVTGGVAMNSVGFDPTIKQKLHIGQTVGVVARFTSEKYFKSLCALQLELNYTTLGWKENVLNSSSEPLPDTYQRNMHYLQLPILARMGWGKEQKGVMGYVIAGLQLGFCIGEDTKQSMTPQQTTDAAGNAIPAVDDNGKIIYDRPNGMYEQYYMPVERKFDYGITAGLGLELSTKAGHFLLEGRYYYGLSDIFGNSKKDTFGRSNNNTIVVKFTYLFDIRK